MWNILAGLERRCLCNTNTESSGTSREEAACESALLMARLRGECFYKSSALGSTSAGRQYGEAAALSQVPTGDHGPASRDLVRCLPAKAGCQGFPSSHLWARVSSVSLVQKYFSFKELKGRETIVSHIKSHHCQLLPICIQQSGGISLLPSPLVRAVLEYSVSFDRHFQK